MFSSLKTSGVEKPANAGDAWSSFSYPLRFCVVTYLRTHFVRFSEERSFISLVDRSRCFSNDHKHRDSLLCLSNLGLWIPHARTFIFLFEYAFLHGPALYDI